MSNCISWFLKWQPCHFPVMVFWLLWAIYLGFSQCVILFMLVLLSHISIYNNFLVGMAQLCVSTNLECIYIKIFIDFYRRIPFRIK